MNDEIREIFNIEELFDEWKRFLSWCYENNDKTVEIHRDKLKWVMDYITNLQDERERLINAWETAVDDFEKEYAKNERAKEVYIKELIEAHNRSEDMPLVAVEMYNILQGNKK